jgi:uncharacterized protein YdiU (UPF0061 family)
MVYSSIDQGGRYAYQQQPHIGQWNLAQFAQCLRPLLADDDEASADAVRSGLEAYATRFNTAYQDGLAAKIGVAEHDEGDIELARNLLQAMAEQGADFTLTFRRLADLSSQPGEVDESIRELFADGSAFDAWAARWRERLARDSRDDAARRAAMRAVNPAYIPRNHRIQQAIDTAEVDDWQPLEDLLTVVARPYEDHPELADYAQPPRSEEVIQRTFCGT